MGLIDFLNVLLRLNIPLFCVLMFMKGRNCHCHPGSSEISLSLWANGELSLLVGPIHFPQQQGALLFPWARVTQEKSERSSTVFVLCISFLGFQTLGNHADTLVLPWRNGPVAYLGAMSPTSFGRSSWCSSPQDRIKKGIRAGS